MTVTAIPNELQEVFIISTTILLDCTVMSRSSKASGPGPLFRALMKTCHMFHRILLLSNDLVLEKLLRPKIGTLCSALSIFMFKDHV